MIMDTSQAAIPFARDGPASRAPAGSPASGWGRDKCINVYCIHYMCYTV